MISEAFEKDAAEREAETERMHEEVFGRKPIRFKRAGF